MQIFKSIINSLFSQKSLEFCLRENEDDMMETSFSVGIEFCKNMKGKKKTNIQLDELSSGEKNLLVMYYKLIFVDFHQCNTYVFIDEPETSLHIDWQRKYVDILDKILFLRGNAQCIVVTHSPSIIGEHADITNVLEG